LFKRAIALALAGLMTFISLPALGHAQLLDAEPKANQVLATSPIRFQLNFSDSLIDLGPTSNWITVFDSQGIQVSGLSVLKDNQISAQPLQPLKSGRYEVSWRVLSEDGHPVQGSYSFTIERQALTLTARAISQKTVTLSFSERLVIGTKVTVLGHGSKKVKGTLRISGKQAIFSFAVKLPAGKYQVHFLAKSAGGITARGSSTITLR
jgi:methionine-rich copper-binding protein CopC